MKLQKIPVIIFSLCVLTLTATFTLYKNSFLNDHTEMPSLLANLIQLDGTGPQFSYDIKNNNYVILHFWASWCGPCVSEMPTLYSVHEKLKSKFQLILISEDDNQKEALSFLYKIGKPPSQGFTWWDQNKKISAVMSVFKLPETFIYDSHFKLIRKIAGPMNWEDPKNFSYLQSL